MKFNSFYFFAQQAFGTDIPPYTYFAMSVLIGLPIVGFIVFEMWKTLGENRRIRNERRKKEAIDEVRRFRWSGAQDPIGAHGPFFLFLLGKDAVGGEPTGCHNNLQYLACFPHFNLLIV